MQDSQLSEQAKVFFISGLEKLNSNNFLTKEYNNHKVYKFVI